MTLSTPKIINKQLQLNIDNRWRGLGDVTKLNLKRHFENGIFLPHSKLPIPLLEKMYDSNFFGFVCKEIFNIELLPFQLAILEELWKRPFPLLIGSRGMSKTFLLGVYALLRAFLLQGSNVIVVGSAFRQSKQVIAYSERVWNNAPILRNICNEKRGSGISHENDKWTLTVGHSQIIAIPIGTGDKIRGFRANCLIADEFASQSREIFEIVIKPFGSVSPNPVGNVKLRAAVNLKKELGLEISEDEQRGLSVQNQSIISGTADFYFNHFYEYWQNYKRIILSRGDPRVLADLFPEGVPEGFDYRDYSIIRIPYKLIPEGFFDMKLISSAKANNHSSHFLKEFEAVFVKDTNGFFPRSMIELCVANNKNLSDARQTFPQGLTIFDPRLNGDSKYKYVMGVDPASENDNFTIVILEIHDTHRRIVYCWSTNIKKQRKIYAEGLTPESDYYSFCCRKIRNLMKIFPIEAIAIDRGGGGIAIIEGLHDKDKMEDNEVPLWPIVEEDKEKPTDLMSGPHIIHEINFSDNKWVCEANHGLKKDFQDKTLYFPDFSAAFLGRAIELGEKNSVGYDTVEECVMEIEELKNELTTITHTQTPGKNLDKWDTPEKKTDDGKKGRQRKDRYTGLLMANSVARRIARTIVPEITYTGGGFSNTLAEGDGGFGEMYSAPDWFREGMNEAMRR